VARPAVESLDARRWDVAAGSAVTAGISACDAITGTLIGQRAGGRRWPGGLLIEPPLWLNDEALSQAQRGSEDERRVRDSSAGSAPGTQHDILDVL